MIILVFIALVFIIVMAPLLGQIGGSGYEALFVVLALVIIIGGVVGYARRATVAS